MSGTHLMFVRHGETVGNIEQIAHGRSESPLNERGIRQAEATAERLANWGTTYHRVYCSPLSRAHDTARTISDRLSLPLHVHSDLQEGFLGDWEGVTYEQLHEHRFAQRSSKDDDFRGHNGESPNMLADRMVGAIEEILARHAHENLIIVSHGAAISHAMAKLLGTQPVFGYQYLMHNSAITEITLHPDPVISVLNDHEHIPAELKADPMRKDARTDA